ncbi:hypothetical protein ACZ90_45830 [Streptomyces albus subsp. albus]|nr:hypothetical protein ACZ90_45830 [Streptomyces albus subsp. albus]
MWRDESTTYQAAHRSYGEIWHLMANADVVHGLYYLFMHAVFGAWEGGLLTLRLPSVLAMAAAAAGVGLTGRRLAGKRVGLAAGLVFPLLPPVQQYAQEGRSHALVCALLVWSGVLLLGAVDRPRKRTWAGCTLLVVLACLMHEFAVLASAAHGAALWLARVPRATRRAWTWSACCVVLVLAPLALASRRQGYLVDWIGFADGPHWLVYGAVSLLGGLCALAPAPAAGAMRLRVFALPLLILPKGLLLVVGFGDPLYVAGSVLCLYAGLALLIGAALEWALRVARRRGRAALTLVLALAVSAGAATVPTALWLRTPQSRPDDTIAAAHAVRALSEPGDGVLFLPGRRREPMLSHPWDFARLRDLALDRGPIASGTLHGTELPASGIRARLLSVNRVVTINDPAGQPLGDTPQERAKRAVLREHFVPCAHRDVVGMRIISYARPGKCAPRHG